MKNVYVNAEESLWLYNRFKEDFVSLDEILNELENLSIENDQLKEDVLMLEKQLQNINEENNDFF